MFRNRCYKRWLQRKNLLRTRFGIPMATAVLQETLFLFKTKKQSPKYLFELLPTARQAYMTRHNNSIPHLNVKYGCFKNSFFPSTVI